MMFTYKGTSVFGTLADESATHYTIEKTDGDFLTWPKASTELTEDIRPSIEVLDLVETLEFKPSTSVPVTKGWLLEEIQAMNPHSGAKMYMKKAVLEGLWKELAWKK